MASRAQPESIGSGEEVVGFLESEVQAVYLAGTLQERGEAAVATARVRTDEDSDSDTYASVCGEEGTGMVFLRRLACGAQ